MIWSKMFLNTLQGKGRAPLTKNDPDQNDVCQGRETQLWPKSLSWQLSPIFPS